jgi:hypothetical protein
MAAAKKPASAVSNEFTLGTPWTPDPALKMPDPRIPAALTEPGDENTLLAPARSVGLGFSRYS